MSMGIHLKSDAAKAYSAPKYPPSSVQVKNRRKRYLEAHPEYFSPDLELAGPHALFLFSCSYFIPFAIADLTIM